MVRVPDDKFKDKLVKDMSEYVCTAEEVAGHPVTYEDVRDALVAAMADAGVDLEPSELNEGERKGWPRVSTRVGDPEMVRRVSSERFVAERPGGLGSGWPTTRAASSAGPAWPSTPTAPWSTRSWPATCTCRRPTPSTASPPSWSAPAADDPDDLRRRISSVFDQPEVTQAEQLMGVTTDDLLAAVTKAIAVAAATPAR